MNILFDNIIFSIQRSGGISVYWAELLKRILQQSYVESTFLEYDESEKNIFRKTFDIPQEKIMHQSLSFFSRYQDVSMKSFREGIFHSSYYRNFRPISKNVKQVATVHDFTYEIYYGGLKKQIHCWQKKKALEVADAIICVSDNTRKDMFDFYPFTKDKNVKVIHNGVSESFFPLSSIEKPIVPFVLYVGSRVSYKNFDFAVNVLENLPDYQLMIVGATFSEQEKSLLDGKLPGRYQLKHNVSNQELNILYNSAVCLLYPSSYEGFGIPMIEAMKAACPVVTLRSSSIPEVCGDSGIILDQLNTSIFTDAIISIDKNKEELVESGLKRASLFSWDKSFSQTLELYSELDKTL